MMFSTPTNSRLATPTRSSMNVMWSRSEEHTSELQSQSNFVCRLLLEKKTHALSHLGFLAGALGRLITLSTAPVIARYCFELAGVDASRPAPVSGGLALSSCEGYLPLC